MEEIFSQFSRIGLIVESIIAECLGLPPNLLQEHNNDRSWDNLAALYYLPATDKGTIGVSAHKDISCITLVLQDQVGGLEVEKDGDWIPLPPLEGALLVNIGDVIQFKSPSHRVLRPEGRSRNSVAFFFNISADKWIEPLPEFTKKIEEQPRYRKFLYKEYLQLRKENKMNPPSRVEDEINLKHYAITT
ncbi:hypothetical protein RJ640_010588 [Escallonia rubra]|uniref:Fe2OG dioxygenase domain-containing protein n=1 Tax=Escallonia rubra TaxID=112253 RepID=A0AA88QP03_9ASTE|nr:hypothetical protein RJ640_010588 [Escallonia rubra]